jgi:antitoxin ParD1/3/4
MSKVDEIKAAAAQLPAADKLDLYRWLDESEEVRAMRREELRREIQKGIDSLARGEGVPLDIEEIKREGRRRLAGRNGDA